MSHNLLLVLPLLLPLLGAVACLLVGQRAKVQAILAGVVQAAWLASASVILYEVSQNGIFATRIGNWPAPFGITFVADLFGALILTSAAVVGLAVWLFSLQGLDFERKRIGYYPLLLLLQMGVSGACLTGDIFNLYVWFEVLLICCFALLSLGGTRAQLEGTLKYVTINLIASGLLLTGIGVIYSLFGSLNMAVLAQQVRQHGHQSMPLLSLTSIFFLTGFGIKSAIFPLFFWLPASYHTPPIAISAFIAGLISKVGIYTLIRLFTLLFVSDLDFMLPLLLVLSGLTMVVGVVGAAAQTDFRKILSFHIISQIGYMLMGLAIYTPLALAGSVFFIVHNILVKTNLFLVSGVVARLHHSFSLKKLGEVYCRQPMLALLFLVSALALAGMPPLSGFWGKFMLAKGGFEAGNYTIVGVSLFVSLATLFSMTKIWNEVFWKNKPASELPIPESAPKATVPTVWLLYTPVVLLFIAILFISVYAEPLIGLAQQAANQLLYTKAYTDAVLNQ
ncbi:Na+/H+ antiporter subunit D [Pontibacter sp. E15-1]|uniref:proton-conducting transporter transmembrane domain-containing protein n=1 Tax=Pontibacter sp. E15-1 TaxID=2919918 RepID=UPI001F4FC41A|nr:proton-conducting transporter membrane subunit [Pontibacter sp. E15-1]MCJ8163655.1 Na+/H+ antiporter subunit D [Pontibacter sp. E15-1]